jgi:hypothetical protein
LADIPGLTFNCWWRLRNALIRFKTTKINHDTNGKILDIADFSNSLKKGSKKIRKFFDIAREKNCSLEATTTFKTFVSLVGIAPSIREFLTDWTAAWSYNPLTNDLKKFIFNCRYNLLPLNNRLNAYLPNIDPRCTFCRIRDPETAIRDSFSHCFYNCPHTRKLLTEFFSAIGKNFNDDSNTKNMYWYGISNDDITSNNRTSTTLYNIVFDVVRYVIYKWRLKNTLPTYNEFISHTVYILENICKSNKKFHRKLSGIPSLASLVQALGIEI